MKYKFLKDYVRVGFKNDEYLAVYLFKFLTKEGEWKETAYGESSKKSAADAVRKAWRGLEEYLSKGKCKEGILSQVFHISRIKKIDNVGDRTSDSQMWLNLPYWKSEAVI